MNYQTADLCDDNQNKKIQVLPAKFKNYGGLKKFHGQVVTMKLNKSNFTLLEMLRDEQGDGKIVVVDNSEHFFGVVGDRLLGYAKKNNWKAIILNGYVRDTDETEKIDVGLYAIGTCPLRNFEQTEAKREIILDFQGIIVKPGDYVYADNDGIIISKEKLQ